MALRDDLYVANHTIRTTVRVVLQVHCCYFEVTACILFCSLLSLSLLPGGSVPWRSHKTFDHLFTEDDWTDPDLCPPYQASKTVAERRAWDLWRALPGTVNLNLRHRRLP